MDPRVAELVEYTLSEADAAEIARQRADLADLTSRRMNPHGHGKVCAAVVVATFGGPAANLQVLLDGDGSYWATSRMPGGPGEPGTWRRPDPAA